MAGNTGSDGSITIDTRLDTSGFKRESAKLNTAVTSLSRQVNNLGKSLQATMSKGANPAAIERFRIKAAETEQQLQSLRERLMAFGETEIKTDKYNELCAEIKKTEEALQRLYERQEKLKAMGADQSSSQWQTLQKDIDDTTSRLEFYKKGLSEAQEFLREMQTPEAQAEAHAGGPDAWADYKAGLENAEQEVKENRAEVEKLEAALAKLQEKQEQMKAKGADLGSKQWQSLQYDIEQTQAKLDQLTASKEQMENTGTDTMQGSDTEEYQRMAGQVENLEEKLAGMGQRSGIAKSALSGVASVIGRVASAAAKAAVQLDMMIGKAVITGLKQVYSGALKATKALLSLHSSSKKSTSGFKASFMTILKYGLGIRSLYMLFRKLRTAIKESLGTMAKIDGPTNKAISSMKSALDQLKNSLGSAFQPIVTAVAPYITQLLTTLSGAMTKIAEFFAMLTGQKYILRATAKQTDYAKSLDKTSKSAKEAKKQLAGFDELNILTDSSSDKKTDDSAGQFEKVPITGISDFLQRIKDAFLNGDYEEIGRIVAEKINGIFQKINDWISWDNIGGTITKWVNVICGVFNGLVDGINWTLIGQTFANGINTILHTLYLLVTGIDWNNLGTAIGTGLSSMLNNIDWELFGATLANMMTIKLRLLASAILAFDWVSLGANLAQGLNSFVTVIYDTISNIDWVGCVEKMAAGLNQLVTDIDWENLGELIGYWIGTVLTILTTAITEIDWATLAEGVATGFDSVVSKISEAVDAIDWVALGESIVAGINGLINDPDWAGFGVTLGELFNGLLSTLLTILTEFDWAGLGQSLADWVIGVVGTIDWAALAETISTSITGLLTSANEFIQGLDPETIVTAIETFLSNVDWEGIASNLFELLGSALGTLGAVVGGLIRDAFIGIEEYFTEQINACGGNVVAGILKGILDALVGIVTWIDENIFTPFINGILKAFGFEEGSGSSHILVDFGTSIINCIAEGISGLWDAVSGFFSDAWTNITTFFTDLDVGTWFTENVWNKITGAFSGAGEWFKTTASDMWNGITSFFTELGDGIGTWFTENIWNKITGAFDGVKEWFSNMATNIWDGLTGGLESTWETTKEKVTGFFSDIWGGVLDFFGIHSPSTTAADAAENLLSGFAKGAEDNQQSAGERLKSVFNGIYNAAKSVWDGVTGWLSKLFGGGNDESKETKKQAGQVAKGIDDAFKDVEDSISKPVENGVDAGKTAFAALEQTAKDTVKNIKSAFTASGTGLKDVLSKAFDDSDKSINSSMTSIKDKIDTTLESIKTKNTTTLSSIKTTVTTQLSALSTSVTSTVTTMKTKVSTDITAIKTQATNSIQSICTTVVSKVQSMDQSVKSSFTSMSSNIRTTLNNALSTANSMNWYSIGSNICNGISQGINNGWNWLHNTVWNLARSLLNAAKSALGIHSPSKMFKDEVGKMLGLGVAEGMEDSQPTILKSVASVTDAIADEMQDADAVANLQMNGNNLLNDLDGVLTTFSDKVSNTFSDLVDRISAITDTVAFRLPAAVSGGAIPYNVSANAGGGAEGLTDALIASNEDLSNVVIQSVTNATAAIVQAIETYSGTTVNLDKRSLADAIIEEINRRTRMTGKSPILV